MKSDFDAQSLKLAETMIEATFDKKLPVIADAIFRVCVACVSEHTTTTQRAFLRNIGNCLLRKADEISVD